MRADCVDLPGLERALSGLGPGVVHHFATWCDPCAEELPILAECLGEVGTQMRRIAISWDLFLMPVAPETAVHACRSFLERLDVRFDHLLVYTGPPAELFASQGIAQGTVPFTDVRDATGSVVATFPDALFAPDEQQRFLRALRGV